MIPMKRGDNFEWGGQFFAPDGSVQSFAGWSISSQVRGASDCLVEQLTAEWVDATQALYRIYSAGTTGWPTGRLSLDVQIIDASNRPFSSNTQYINVIRDVTHA